MSPSKTIGIAQKVVPNAIWEVLRSVRHARDFKYKTFRSSPTDYLTAYNHTDINKARKSILWHDDWDAATEATIQIFRDLGVLADGMTVIDYGCGIGRMTKALVEAANVKVISVDRSDQMRDHAREYIPQSYFDEGRVELLSDVELAERLPDLQGSVDVVFFIEVLQHIPEHILDELVPSLISTIKPEGNVFVIGNLMLDVDLEGRTSVKPIQTYLQKHLSVTRADDWTEVKTSDGVRKFANLRHSFLCSKA